MLVLVQRAAALFVGSLCLVVLGASAEAQCGNPDFLDGGPCCALTQPNTPVVPDFKQPSLQICWRDCNIDNILACNAQWLQTAQPSGSGPCDIFTKLLRLRDPISNVLKWSGRMKFQYSRTWVEVDFAGQGMQVWRYLINGDMRPTAAAGLPPCPVPPCAPAFGNLVRFTGYVDYVQSCGGPLQEFAWMITHACDAIDHAPGFPRAGAFHPDRTYTFVGPSAGFVVSPLSPPEMGANGFEAIRRRAPILGTTLKSCQYEEQIQQQMVHNNVFCFCGVPTLTPQWALGNLSVFSNCGSTVTTPGGPFLPGFLSMGIGMWTSPTSYPGPEVLRWNTGGYDYFDACAGTLQPEVFFGVTTSRGFNAFQVLSGGTVPVMLPPTFVDQSNSLIGSGVGTTTMNRTYWSDHILNLNY